MEGGGGSEEDLSKARRVGEGKGGLLVHLN